MRLIRRDGVIGPGGYPYTDPKTGFKFDGFSAGGFGDQVLRIIQHRRTNPTFYPPWNQEPFNETFVGNQLDEYQCQRLGNDKRFCVDENLPAVPAIKNPVPVGKCAACGGDLIEKLCSTCSGRRVTGRTCTKCGKGYPP